MTSFQFFKKGLILIVFILTLVSLSCNSSSLSCNSSQDTVFSDIDFGIYLADSGELVLSQEDIKTFFNEDGVFELNEKGVKRWNSFITYVDIPKLSDGLFSKDFVLMVDGEEVCTGKFWSGASSAWIDSEFIILDSLFKLDNEKNKISIQYGYPISQDISLDKIFFPGSN